MKRLGILLSGRGTNFTAIADAIASHHLLGAEIAVVISNIADAPGVKAARARGLTVFVIETKGRSREECDAEMIARLHQHNVDLVCLAGYMRLLSPQFVRAFPRCILNIHPSLLPQFRGLHAQRQALESGAKVTGCTVHFVDEELDHGPIILQRTISILDGDTEETLSARLLKEEHIAYREAIARVLSGKFEVRGRRYVPRNLVDTSAEKH